MIKMGRLGFLFMVLFFGAPWSAYAGYGGTGFHLGMSAARFDQIRKGDMFGGEIKDIRTYYDLKLGYLSNSLYAGLIYSSYGQSSSSDTSRASYGATLGYHGENGFYLDVSYYLSSEYQFSSSIKLKNGSGIGAEFGYNVMVSTNTYLGLELAYRSFTYKQVASNTEYDNENSVTELVPLLNLGFYF